MWHKHLFLSSDHSSALRRTRRSAAVLLILGSLLFTPLVQPPVNAVDVPTPLTPADGAMTTAAEEVGRW